MNPYNAITPLANTAGHNKPWWKRDIEEALPEGAAGVENSAGKSAAKDLNAAGLGSARQRIAELVTELSREAGGRLTLDYLKQKKHDLIRNFEEKVSQGLAQRGTARDIEFTLGLDPASGDFAVSTSHKDKYKVQTYLLAHPELKADYAEIKAVCDIVHALESGGLPGTVTRNVKPDLADYMRPEQTARLLRPNSVFMRYSDARFTAHSGLSNTV